MYYAGAQHGPARIEVFLPLEISGIIYQKPPMIRVMAEGEKDPRVWLAAERTLLAWIRTGLAMMGFGFVVARFGLFLRELEASQQARTPASPTLSLYFGTTLVFIGVVVNVWAAWSHLRLRRQFSEGTWTPETHSRSVVVVALVLAVAGLVVGIYLLVFR